MHLAAGPHPEWLAGFFGQVGCPSLRKHVFMDTDVLMATSSRLSISSGFTVAKHLTL
jgi:hypothetical protein